AVSQQHTTQIARSSDVQAYFDRPSVILVSGRNTLDQATKSVTHTFAIDLVRDSLRAVAAPGQSTTATIAFNAVRGVYENVSEANVVQLAASSTGQSVQVNNTGTVFQLATAQGIPLTLITPATMGLLDGLAISAEAKARITTALGQGFDVVVPTQGVVLNG